MRNAKVRPLIMSSSHSSHDSLPLQLQDGRWSRRGREFWYARRAFLNSYHLSLESSSSSSSNNFKEKLKKSVKQVNQKAVAVVSDMRRGFSNRRLGIKAFRLTMTLPSMLLVTVRCFMPWVTNNTRDIM